MGLNVEIYVYGKGKWFAIVNKCLSEKEAETMSKLLRPLMFWGLLDMVDEIRIKVVREDDE